MNQLVITWLALNINNKWISVSRHSMLYRSYIFVQDKRAQKIVQRDDILKLNNILIGTWGSNFCSFVNIFDFSWESFLVYFDCFHLYLLSFFFFGLSFPLAIQRANTCTIFRYNVAGNTNGKQMSQSTARDLFLLEMCRFPVAWPCKWVL